MANMTDAQKRFADQYLVDLNATRAYRDAYPAVKKDETAAAAGARLLRNVNVSVYIDKRQEELRRQTNITQEDVVRELAAIAFSDPTDYAVIKGRGVRYTPTDELTPVQKKGIQQIKKTKFGVEVIPGDKVKALELLGRHLGMFTDKQEIQQEVLVTFVGENEIPE